MISTWTSEQILTLAPDAASAKAGRGLAVPRHWIRLGCNERAVWGECQGSAQEPYRAGIDLSEPAFKCTCPSRKFPCKHALGLFLLFAGQPGAFNEPEPPAWVAEWLAKRAQQNQRKQAQMAAPDETAAAQPPRKKVAKTRPDAARQAKVEAGLAELELWLRDLARQGLASVQTRPARYWEGMAARMVDAQAPGIARWLREMSSLPFSGEGWPERLLARLGLLYLLLEGFKRIDTLPAPVQADIRTAMGWTYKEEALRAEPGLPDTWLVLGQRIYEEDRLRVQRTWLWGENRRQAALVLDFAFQGQPLDVSLIPGLTCKAELVFYPSNYPLRAVVKDRFTAPDPLTAMPAYPTVDAGLSAYAGALALQPWLELFPLSLEAVHLIKQKDAWLIRDNEGKLISLSPEFDQGWRLLALSGGNPFSLFGEWNGRHLLPLSAWTEGRFVPLSTLV
jgi:hypothetical protein